MVVDFHGFKELVDAVDGVRIRLREPVADRAARLRLPAGRVTLGGEQALGYVRARASLGDGSDTGRRERQQRFLRALVGTVRDDRVLLNPAKRFPVLDAAASALTTDPGLAGPHDLYALLRWLRDIRTGGGSLPCRGSRGPGTPIATSSCGRRRTPSSPGCGRTGRSPSPGPPGSARVAGPAPATRRRRPGAGRPPRVPARRRTVGAGAGRRARGRRLARAGVPGEHGRRGPVRVKRAPRPRTVWDISSRECADCRV